MAGPKARKHRAERIKYLRGAQAEALVAWLLQDLSDDWHIFNGVKLEDDSDIDHVLVGPGGCFCISTKSHRGLFTVTPQEFLHNNQPSDMALQVLRQTMNLRDRLAAIMGDNLPWIQPVLAVPFGYVQDDDGGAKALVVHQDDLIDRIAPDGAARRLDSETIHRVTKALEMIQQHAEEVYRRPDPEAPSG